MSRRQPSRRGAPPTPQPATQPTFDVTALKFETADSWARDINAAYNTYLETGTARWRAIIKVGKKLLAAKAALSPKEWFYAFDAMKVEKPIPISTSYAERFMAIARHPDLSNPGNCLVLPPTVSGLYELRKIDEKGPGTVARLLTERRLTTEMTVEDIKALVPTRQAGGNGDGPAPGEEPSAWSLAEAERRLQRVIDDEIRQCPKGQERAVKGIVGRLWYRLERQWLDRARLPQAALDDLYREYHGLKDATPGQRVLIRNARGRMTGVIREPSTYPPGGWTRWAADRRMQALEHILDENLPRNDLERQILRDAVANVTAAGGANRVLPGRSR